MLLVSFLVVALCLIVSADSSSSKHHDKQHCRNPGPQELPRWSIGVFDAQRDHILCTGTLVGPRVALTSGLCGHVVKQTTNPIFLCNSLEPGSQKRNISQIIVHKSFDETNKEKLWQYSIAAFVFDPPFTSGVELLCLPQKQDHFKGKTCIVTSWGLHPTGLKGKLQRSDAVVRSCELSFVEHKDELICVGGEEYKGAGMGDDGATLACKDHANAGYVFAGLMSVGDIDEECDITPGSQVDCFTNIAHHSAWLRSSIPNNLLYNSSPQAAPSHIHYFLVLSVSFWCLFLI